MRRYRRNRPADPAYTGITDAQALAALDAQDTQSVLIKRFTQFFFEGRAYRFTAGQTVTVPSTISSLLVSAGAALLPPVLYTYPAVSPVGLVIDSSGSGSAIFYVVGAQAGVSIQSVSTDDPNTDVSFSGLISYASPQYTDDYTVNLSVTLTNSTILQLAFSYTSTASLASPGTVIPPP